MVIDPSSGYNKSGINSATSSGSKVKPSTTATPSSTPATSSEKASDSVSLSSKAQAMVKLEAAVADSPDVETAKVAAIKEAVDNGTYEVNPRSIAEKMLDQDALL